MVEEEEEEEEEVRQRLRRRSGTRPTTRVCFTVGEKVAHPLLEIDVSRDMIVFALYRSALLLSYFLKYTDSSAIRPVHRGEGERIEAGCPAEDGLTGGAGVGTRGHFHYILYPPNATENMSRECLYSLYSFKLITSVRKY